MDVRSLPAHPKGWGGALGDVFKRLAEQKESRILEGHLMADYVHMLISIPPKYAVSLVIGFIKGALAIPSLTMPLRIQTRPSFLKDVYPR